MSPPSNKTVIVNTMADPSSVHGADPSAQVKSATASQTKTSLESKIEEAANSSDEAASPTSLPLATADAKLDSLSSQMDDDKMVTNVDVTADAKTVSLTSKMADKSILHIAPTGVVESSDLDGSVVTTEQEFLVTEQLEANIFQEDVAKKKDEPAEAFRRSQSEDNGKQAGIPVSTPMAPTENSCTRAKGLGKRLSKKGEAFTLPSGEACVKIPNSVIEKNRKSWESFVLGQFY